MTNALSNLAARIVEAPSLMELLATRFAIRRIVLTQTIHEGFRAKMEVSVPSFVAAEVLAWRGDHLTIALDEEPFLPRIHGLVTRVRSLITEDPEHQQFEIELGSTAERLRHSRRQRIFHDSSVEQIVQEVFQAYVEVEAPVYAAERGKEKREYVVQFGESDWDFTRRLLAEQGIALLTDPTSARVVAADDTRQEHFGVFELPFRSHSGLEVKREPAIQRIAIETTLVPDAVVVRAFDEERPLLQLEGRAGRARPDAVASPRGAQASREWYEYESHAFGSADQGARHAEQIRAELTAEEESFECNATVGVPVGAHLRITGAPRELPATLLVIRATTEISFPANDRPAVHSTHFVAVPLHTLRPARLAKPRIHGTETAMVRCATGQEIDVDSFGRVEVEFPWDRRDARRAGALRRVRLAHGWAGAGYGIGVVPRSGDEVIVSFLGGDPDEPLIVGRVHNGAAPGPLKLPEEKAHSVWRTQSTPGSDGFNEIRMIDDVGQEVVKMHAQRDFQLVALRDSDRYIQARDSQVIGGPQDIQVRDHKIESVKKTDTQCVGQGSSTQVCGPCKIDCDDWHLTCNERADSIKGLWSSHAGSYSLESKTYFTLKAQEILLDTGGAWAKLENGSIRLVVGGTLIKITDGKILLSTGGSTITLDGDTITQIASLIELNP